MSSSHVSEPSPFIRLLGGATIEIGGVPATGRTAHRHRIALLALLVANRGRAISRDKLIAYLWPERDGDAGRNLLKVAVHGLRKEFGDAAIRTVGDQLNVDPALLRSDVGDFLEAVDAGDDLAAAARYGGPFLDGFFIKDAAELERWTETQREQLAKSYVAALERLAHRAEAAGDFESAARWHRAHLVAEPYQADVAQRLVRALIAQGDRAAAIQFAEAFVRRREDDLGIADEEKLVHLARSAPATAQASSPRPARAPIAPPPVATVDTPPRRFRRRWAAMAIIGLTLVVSTAYELAGRRRSAGAEQRPRAMAGPLRVAAEAFHTSSDNTLSTNINDLGAAIAALLNGDGSARSADASQLLTGEINRSRDSTDVSATLADASTHVVLAAARASWPGTPPTAAVAERMARELAIAVSGEPADRVADLSGRSYAAVRSYLAAQRAYQSARYAEAESLFARALDADTTFGVAGLGLALANSWTGINDHYGRGRDAALHYRTTLSRRDVAFFDAYFGPDPVLGPPRPAPVYLAAWEDLVEKWPDWRDAWYELGDRYYHFGGLSGLADPGERARTAFRRAVAIDSTFVAPLHHLVELYAARGEADALRIASDRYFAANPSIDRNAGAIGWEIAMGLGDSAWVARIRANLPRMSREDLVRIAWVTDVNGWPRADAERAADLLVRRSTVTSEREAALKVQFALAVNAGQPSKAHAAAAALGAIFPDRPMGAIWELLAATFADPDSVAAADAARRLADFAQAPLAGDHVRRDQQYLARCLVGYWRATTGNDAAARLSATRLHAEIPLEKNNFAARNARVCVGMLDAELAVRRRAPKARGAVADLDSLLLSERVPPHVTLEIGTLVAARLHAALGDTAGALNAARRREHLTGDPMFLSSQLLVEARLAESARDDAEAARAYRHYLALRPAAESGAANEEVARARAALARLDSRR